MSKSREFRLKKFKILKTWRFKIDKLSIKNLFIKFILILINNTTYSFQNLPSQYKFHLAIVKYIKIEILMS